SNLNVDTSLSVANQLSDSLNNLASGATSSAGINYAFHVDSHGNFLDQSTVNSTTAMQFQDASGHTIANIDTVNDKIALASDLEVGKDITAWGVSGYSYRRQITIKNNSGGALSNYQVKIVIDTATPIAAGKMLSNCNDIRFTDTDGTTNLPYWIENGCNTNYTTVWVEVPSILFPSKMIYMYYGNSAAAAGTYPTGPSPFIDVVTNVQAAYRLDEPTYDPIVDYSTNGNVATASGTTVVNPGLFGNNRSFNGTTDYITASNSASLRVTQPYTVSAWFNTSQSTRGDIIEEQDGNFRFGLAIGRTVAGKVDAVVTATGTVNTLTSKNTYNDGNWHYAVLSVNGANLNLSIDNKAEKSITISGVQGAPTGELDIGT
ncbi:MAG: DUF2341 domain-containing protein, partial [Patescibacteria group bacterium]|nr:DUF2341 domain-containing protein [Patescibacteria group bacterium]